MKGEPAKSVDEYLRQVAGPQRKELERIRRIVRETVPGAEESISYMMPAFKYKKKPLVYYAAFQNHLSLFPTSGPTETLKEQLRAYETSKGTIKFTLENPLPEGLIKEILKARIGEIEAKHSVSDPAGPS